MEDTPKGGGRLRKCAARWYSAVTRVTVVTGRVNGGMMFRSVIVAPGVVWYTVAFCVPIGSAQWNHQTFSGRLFILCVATEMHSPDNDRFSLREQLQLCFREEHLQTRCTGGAHFCGGLLHHRKTLSRTL